jgi:tRNA(Ile)-lysidine synthase
MARTHPPTLLTQVRRALREECHVRRGHRMVVAVSGGGDSAALLHALACLRSRFGLELFAHGVDHGLRAEAADELALASGLAARLKVPFSCSHVDVRPGSNLQARARKARYQSLQEARARCEADFIATGHHADDRAETVLMRLLRGAGPQGLAVLPARSETLLRPMIRVRKAEVLAHLGRHGIEFALDPSNQDARFLRVRVRRELMPLLEAISPRVVEHLNALADQLAAGAPPLLLDIGGQSVPLGRAQTAQIRRAQRLGLSRVRVRLPAGREATVEPKTGRIRIVTAASGTARGARRGPGGGKAPGSG